jgi:hypothetical protein
MSTTVRAFLPLQGDPLALHHAFAGDPGSWLPDATQVGPSRWAMTVHGGGMSRSVEAQVGHVWSTGQTAWRSLSWDPTTDGEPSSTVERLLPSLDGEIGLHHGAGSASLVIDARYQPPGGQLGAALDSLAHHRVARRTVERLLADVANTLAERARATAPVDADRPAQEQA